MPETEKPPAVDPGQETPPTRANTERRAPAPMIPRRAAALNLYEALSAWYRDPANKEAYERSIA